MTRRWLERSLWSGAGIALCLAALGAWRAMPGRPPVARAALGVVAIPPAITPESLAALAARTVDADPFRLARHPAQVAYHPGAVAAAVQPPPPPRHPVLSLAGIVGGPPWTALLNGVPGRQGTAVAHAGDTLGGLRVRRVTHATVTITGMDTTWILRIQQPWH